MCTTIVCTSFLIYGCSLRVAMFYCWVPLIFCDLILLLVESCQDPQYIKEDLSRGLECHPILMLRSSNGASHPREFQYLTRSVVSKAASVKSTLDQIERGCSDCGDSCLAVGKSCSCYTKLKEFAYLPGGILKPKYLEQVNLKRKVFS